MKIIIKKERPCVDLDLDYCSPDYDIPSGHSLSGIYFSLLLLEKNGKNIKNSISILSLILQPLFRIIQIFIQFKYILNEIFKKKNFKKEKNKTKI